jgi:hypothetical protein
VGWQVGCRHTCSAQAVQQQVSEHAQYQGKVVVVRGRRVG